MKKLFTSLVIIFCTALNPVLSQSGWTIYNDTNSILAPGTFSSLAIDQTGNIWAGSPNSGLFKFDGSIWTDYSSSHTNILHNFINDILVDNSNNIWVANYKGLSMYNGTTFINYDTSNAPFKGVTVYALGKDNNGKIWLASRQGSFGYKDITIYDGSVWTDLATLAGLDSIANEHPDFAFTSSNDVWIAYESGIKFFNSSTNSLSFYPKATTGLWSSSTVAIDANGTVWAGGFDGILRNNGTWHTFDNVTDLGLSSNTLYYDFYIDGNTLWAGTSSGLLNINLSNGSIVQNFNSTNSPLEDNCVNKIQKDSNGNLWMATTIGVVKMNPAMVGVEKMNEKSNIIVSPNPSTGNYKLEYDKKFSYRVYSIDGSLILDGDCSDLKLNLDLTQYENGIYFLAVYDKGSLNHYVKLVKN
jgi:ligand-binding sensor domain-containing protein